MAVQTSNIISTQVFHLPVPLFGLPLLSSYSPPTQIYQNKDKPLYYTGNKVLLGIAAYNVILFVGAKFFYTWKNR
jgi:hypothetical protein